jgi:hypothetical protein
LRFWFVTLSDICSMEVRVPECSWNQYQIGLFGIFTITSFLGFFKLWKFHRIKETYKNISCKKFICRFVVISKICSVEIRVLECSRNQFQTGQFGILIITFFLGLFRLWKNYRTKETYISTSGKKFRIIFT